MKDFNFNTLRDLPVPDSWIENALLIPEREEAKAVVPFRRKPRFIALAASLLLVSALSAALFLSTGKSPVTVKPSPYATEIVWTTDADGETVATEIVVVTDDPDPSNPDGRQGSVRPTENRSASANGVDRVGSTSPTESADNRRRKNPTAAPGPSERSGAPAESKPHDETSPADSPTQPSEASTESMTEEESEIIINGPGGWNSTEAPTATPWVDPSEPSWTDPTTPTAPRPTESRCKASVSISVSVYTVSQINKEGGTVYCRIYDDDGNSFGDSDLYSDQHLATLTLTYNSRILSYTPRDYGILPEDGLYRFEFYTPSGRIVVSGSAYLSAS